jgi:hypothetical protein
LGYAACTPTSSRLVTPTLGRQMIGITTGPLIVREIDVSGGTISRGLMSPPWTTAQRGFVVIEA